MDKRNSKRQMLERIEYLEAKAEELFDVGVDGIQYVGAANYEYREFEALNKLHDVYLNSELKNHSFDRRSTR